MGISFAEGIRRNPPVYLLFTAIGFGISFAAYTGVHFFRNDPTLLLKDKKTIPHPWQLMDQGTNIKFNSFHNVNQKFDKNVRKGYHDDL
ncbi:hypothetical protein HDU98_008941 [Podochytrium sp. JEL0797]|nr:hypothetical protein HDU98_008941 [Podochytrium sp. JEL0797]